MTRFWAVLNRRNQVIPGTVRTTRSAAISIMAGRGTARRRNWRRCQAIGCRCARVEVREVAV